MIGVLFSGGPANGDQVIMPDHTVEIRWPLAANLLESLLARWPGSFAELDWRYAIYRRTRCLRDGDWIFEFCGIFGGKDGSSHDT